MAGHLSLGKLIVLFDDNEISIDGPTSLTVSDDQLARFKASGWDVASVDGHDYDAIESAIAAAQKTDKPSLIACKTTIAYGAPTKAGTSSSHGAPLGDEEIAGARKQLGWDAQPFEIPQDILAAWREVGQKSVSEYDAWQERYQAASNQEELERACSGQLPASFSETVLTYKKQLTDEKPKWATRKSSGEVLNQLSAILPELVGGSADLTGSNLTQATGMAPVSKDDFSGNYIYYGVREHAMAAAMNGMALHGGFIPYGGTFLVFTDYCRPSIRLSALMQQRVVYVMTHDSIGLGEDGPTHQPVEHVASLRAIPNVYVFRPADAVETLESWQSSLELANAPSVLALTRQGVPLLRTEYSEENLTQRGAYVISEASDANAAVSLFASGSEVQLAVEAQSILQSQYGIAARVVSVPCMELFEEQDAAYQASVLGNSAVNVAVEAAIRQGWDRFIGNEGIFVGMTGFGASAPADELYSHFNITVDHIVEVVNQTLGNELNGITCSN
jgi:transketolase